MSEKTMRRMPERKRLGVLRRALPVLLAGAIAGAGSYIVGKRTGASEASLAERSAAAVKLNSARRRASLLLINALRAADASSRDKMDALRATDSSSRNKMRSMMEERISFHEGRVPMLSNRRFRDRGDFFAAGETYGELKSYEQLATIHAPDLVPRIRRIQDLIDRHYFPPGSNKLPPVRFSLPP